jgi:hypothetical protein
MTCALKDDLRGGWSQTEHFEMGSFSIKSKFKHLLYSSQGQTTQSVDQSEITGMLQVVASDTHVASSLSKECYTYNPHEPKFNLPEVTERAVHSEGERRHRKCVSDEHYVATVLAVNGLDAEVMAAHTGTLNPMLDNEH